MSTDIALNATNYARLLKGMSDYLQKLQDYSDNDYKTNYGSLWESGLAPIYVQRKGKRWIKIVYGKEQDLAKGGAVFCFIDPNNGDIYKGATWHAPAKGVRGNIFDEKPPLTLGSLYK